MPLVTIKYMTSGHHLAVKVMENLPEFFRDNSIVLGLGEDLLLMATQIELLPFGDGRFQPDTWIKIEFTEPFPGDDKSREIRDFINVWLLSIRGPVSRYTSVSLDIFWGPGRGVMHFSNEGGWDKPIFW